MHRVEADTLEVSDSSSPRARTHAMGEENIATRDATMTGRGWLATTRPAQPGGSTRCFRGSGELEMCGRGRFSAAAGWWLKTRRLQADAGGGSSPAETTLSRDQDEAETSLETVARICGYLWQRRSLSPCPHPTQADSAGLTWIQQDGFTSAAGNSI